MSLYQLTEASPRRTSGPSGADASINENAFTAAIREGHTTGSPWMALIPAIGTALIAALAIAGTRPRLAEYR